MSYCFISNKTITIQIKNFNYYNSENVNKFGYNYIQVF